MPSSRFTSRAGLMLLVPEERWSGIEQPGGPSGEELCEQEFREQIGSWVFERDAELGAARPVSGQSGRGASAWAAVLEWAVEPAVKGVVSLAAATAVKRIWDQIRREAPDAHITISRGMAAALAADAVRATANVDDLIVEAVEEPSHLAGEPVHEVAYVGIEPWIALLRSEQARRRYIVCVAPDGDIMGQMDVPLLEYEAMYLRPAE